MFTRWAIIWTCCFYCIYNSYAVTDICSMGWKIVTIISQKCSKALTLVIILETQTIDIFRIFSFMMLISLDLLNVTYYILYIEIILNVICMFINVTARFPLILYLMHIWIIFIFYHPTFNYRYTAIYRYISTLNLNSSGYRHRIKSKQLSRVRSNCWLPKTAWHFYS